MNKTACLERKTRETDIKMTVIREAETTGLEGTTGIGFFDHMLNTFAVHGGFFIRASVKGDLVVDGHHTVEDTGIVLGGIMKELCGDRSGINRFGSAVVPMDDSLAEAVIDISGRPYLVYNVPVASPMIGGYDTQLTIEFFRALAFSMGATLHINLRYGENDHHKIESCFKAAARAISQAMTERSGAVLSAKGVL